METFPSIVRNKLGLELTSQELTNLFLKYYIPATGCVDYDRLTSDLAANFASLRDKEIITKADVSLNINHILDKIRVQLFEKLSHWKEGDKLKNAFRLLSQSRSSIIDRSQLKNACQYRLALAFSDRDIDEIFKMFDPYGSGAISVKTFINAIMRVNTPPTKNSASVDVGFDKQQYKIKNFNADENQNAILTYDKKYIGLRAPEPAACLKITLAELEDIIRDKIAERSSLSSNTIQTLTKLFGDGHNTSGYNYISPDQMRYTIWKRLKLNVSEDLLSQFFTKYDKSNSGRILMFDFIDGIIRTKQRNEPLLDDRFVGSSKSMALKFKKSDILARLFMEIRDKINILINKMSRAPHYLFHSVSRMTKAQAYGFFLNKLQYDVKASFPGIDVFDELDEDYLSSGLIDVQRILIDAMSISDAAHMTDNKNFQRGGGSGGRDWGNTNNLSLRNGAVVDVDKMPVSLQAFRISPKEIGEIIFQKCLERMKHNHPLSSLHRILRESESDDDPRVITRAGLKNVLRKFDVIMNEEDFDAFFRSHDRGDGKINAREFLDSIVPKNNYDQNPLLPKDEEVFKIENTLARALEKVTGRRREVSVMNGSTSTRLQGEVVMNTIHQVLPNSDVGAKSAPNLALSVQAVAMPPKTGRPTRPLSSRAANTISSGHSSSEQDASVNHPSQHGPEINDETAELKDYKPLNANYQQQQTVSKNSALIQALKAVLESRKQQQESEVVPIPAAKFHPTLSNVHFVVDPNASEGDERDGESPRKEKGTPFDASSASWNRSVRPSTAPVSKKALLRINNFKKLGNRLKMQQRVSQKSISNPADSKTRKSSTGKSSVDIFKTTSVTTTSESIDINKNANNNITNIGGNNASSGGNNENNNSYQKVLTAKNVEQLMLQRKSNDNNNDEEKAQTTAQSISTPVKGAQRVDSFAFTPRSPSSPRSSTQTPRSTASRPSVPSSSRKSSTPQSPTAKSPFVYTGQRRRFVQDPFSVGMHLKYALDKRHLVTSHEDYGMFVKSMTKAAKSQKVLAEKHKATISLSHSSAEV